MGEEHWGQIFGNINIADVDTIIVSDGVTSFDGIVNDDGLLLGEMMIAEGGTLFMRLNDLEGASQVNVREFEQEAGSDLWLEIAATPDEGGFPAGPTGNFIGQVNGDVVVLDGTATLRPRAGLYQNTFTYEDVVTAQATGDATDWQLVSRSPLLDPEAVPDTGDIGNWTALDIDVTRVAFNAVGGLTTNQFGVGSGIEGSYPGLLAGLHADTAYRTLVESLFTLDYAEYTDALRQLSGAEYAQGLYSVVHSLELLKRAENARMKYDPAVAVVHFAPVVPVDIKDPLPAPPPEPLAVEYRGAVWINLQAGWADFDGDENAPGYDQSRRSVHVGADYLVMPGLTVGAMVGYFAADLDFDNGHELDYDGVQLGAYAKYEWDAWYANAIVGFGSYSGDAWRAISFGPTPDPLECGCFVDPANDTLSSVNRGSFNARAWLVSGEVGHRFHWGDASWIAPFVGLTYQHGTISRFNETAIGSGAGSALSVGGSGHSLVSDLGVRVGHTFLIGETARATAELRASWLHEFGDNPQDISMSFVGITGSGFRIVSSEVSRDTLALDAGLSVELIENLKIGVSYLGRFNSDYHEHGVMGRATYRFSSH